MYDQKILQRRGTTKYEYFLRKFFSALRNKIRTPEARGEASRARLESQ